MIRIIEDYIYFLEATGRINSETKKLYIGELTEFFKFLRNKKFSKIHQEDVLKYITALRKENLQPSTIKKKITVLKSFFKFLEDQEKISISPLYRISFKNHLQPKKLLKTLSKEQVKEMLTSEDTIYKMKFNEIRNECIIRLFLSSGIRRNELLSLRLPDVDMEKKQIKIKLSKKRERIALFDDVTKHWLEIYLKRREIYKSKGNWFFINKMGKPVTLPQLRCVVEKYFKKATGKKSFACHKFRHTFATILLEHGANPKVVQELLGHADIKTTLGIYSHPSREYIEKVYRQTNPFKDKNIDSKRDDVSGVTPSTGVDFDKDLL